MTRTLALALLSVVLVASMAFGGVPQLVNYQGKLTDAVGKPVTATKSMEFAFYDAASGGTQLGGFTETQKVSVTTGIFNVLIGSATAGGVPASVFSGTNVYLSVKVAGEELEPRQRIASVAYAYRAASADSAAGSTNADLLDSLDSTQFLRSDASDTTSGTLTVERGVDATGTNGRQMILPGGGFEIVPGNPGLKATGTAGGLLTPGAPAVEAIGGGGTLIGSIDTAIRSIGNVYFLNHDDPWHGIYFNPGNGTSDYACDMGLYGSTGTSYAGIRFQFDTEYTADNGPRFRTGDGSVFSIYGSSVSDPRQLRFSGPSYGELILDWANGVIQLGGSTADTVKVPADIEGGLRVYHDIGGGANSCAIRAENTNAGGIAYTGVVTSTDACAVFINKGTGDIIRGFSGATGGNMLFRVLNSGRVVCTELQLTGGADIAEPFNVVDAAKIEPGMVVSIDADNPGKLRLSTTAYDTQVAGIVSGAGGVKPGLTMKQEGTPADGSHPVALSGRVYCWCDASNGPIKPGDLLTTSSTPGHAMKVSDRDRANGAMIGKAMTALKEGRGLVLVLVSLQ